MEREVTGLVGLFVHILVNVVLTDKDGKYSKKFERCGDEREWGIV